jgi:excisionase family DNA binding protein
MSDGPFLTSDEVLGYLRVNLRTLYRLIRIGQIPAVRLGHQWRFRRRDIDAWLRGERRTGPLARRARVLVVDDEPDVLDMVAKGLAQKYDVETADDGKSALDRLRSEEYDLLITDLKMPGLDGLSVIREARRQVADLPVLIITGNSTEASAIEAINIGGVFGYLTKPFRIPKVLEMAARALGGPEATTEVHAATD